MLCKKFIINLKLAFGLKFCMSFLFLAISFPIFLAFSIIFHFIIIAFFLSLSLSIFSIFLWGQFHQHFMNSFYESRSQKHKRHWWLDCLFALLGSLHVKDACKQFGEIYLWTLLFSISHTLEVTLSLSLFLYLPLSLSSLFWAFFLSFCHSSFTLLTILLWCQQILFERGKTLIRSSLLTFIGKKSSLALCDTLYKRCQCKKLEIEKLTVTVHKS